MPVFAAREVPGQLSDRRAELARRRAWNERDDEDHRESEHQLPLIVLRNRSAAPTKATKTTKTAANTASAPDDSLDIASMTREERDRLKRKLLTDHPELAEGWGLVT